MPAATSSMVAAVLGGRLRGDPGVEVDLQQQVAELLAQVVGVAGLDRFEGLVGLLDEVGRASGGSARGPTSAAAAGPPR